MRYNLEATFTNKDDLLRFHEKSPADAYTYSCRYGKKYTYYAYRKAVNDLKWEPGQRDLLKGEFAMSPHHFHPNEQTCKTDDNHILGRKIRDKRIAVCKDIQKQIKLRALNLVDGGNGYIVTGDEYCSVTQDFTPEDFHKDLQDYVDVLVPLCEVCMLGAAVLSMARVHDNIPMGNHFDEKEARNYYHKMVGSLKSVFDEGMLNAMESAFEEYESGYLPSGFSSSIEPGSFGEKAAQLCRNIPRTKIQMTPAETKAWCIAQNIINNDGVFDPSQKPTLYPKRRSKRGG